MIFIKLLPLWMALTLIVATARPERRRRDVLSRSHLWEAAFNAWQRNKQWPKRNSLTATVGPPTYQPCVCDESMGFLDLGEGYWPRMLPSRQCGFNISPFTALCDAPDHETMFKCAERVYGVHVLRRRQGRSESSGQHMLPPELHQDWEMVVRNVTISCELQVDM